jgi:hypothetical protein
VSWGRGNAASDRRRCQLRISTSFHLVGRKILFPGEEHPYVTERIPHAGRTRAVEHLGGRLDFLRARVDRASKQRRVVVREDVQARRTAAGGPGIAVEPAVRIADHEH